MKIHYVDTCLLPLSTYLKCGLCVGAFCHDADDGDDGHDGDDDGGDGG